jgi:riboflavin kinase/FMN adenylyltransferase
MFDGVHRGHQFVLQEVVATAHERGLQSMVITFDHSLHSESVLTPLEEKLTLLSKAGVDHVEVLSFTDELKQMTARQFMEQVLKRQLSVTVLLTGYDNRFGHNREEGFDDYVRYGHELGIEVLQLPAKGKVSSSLIRHLLQEGRVSESAECLGHAYTIVGRVEHGEHVGTQLGFPTANLMLSSDSQLLPAPGAYAVKVRLEGSLEFKHGMMNIGHRPTFHGHRQTLEVHIFHLNEDLYGQQLLVSFVDRLRGERCFSSAEALVGQLRQDAAQAEEILNQEIAEL